MKQKPGTLISVAALMSALMLSSCATAPRNELEPEVGQEIMDNIHVALEPSLLVGIWQGVIKAGGSEVRLVFHLSHDGGQWTATVDSPDQGVEGIPVESTTVEASKISLEIPAAGARYEGTLNDDNSVIEGNWYQAGGTFPVDLQRVDKVEKITRPQDPVPPFPYDERDVSFYNEEAGITLAGTLTMPRGDGPFPAAILVSGSGAQNRNEETYNHRPFLVLADHLTRAGIAVLRYDDRGVGESDGDATTGTSADFAGDALAAFHFLEEQPGINRDMVGIIGHSEGGGIAPYIAAEYPEVDFIVMLAGPGFRGDVVLLQQSEAILRAGGAADEQIKRATEVNRSVYAVVNSEPDDEEAAEKIRKILFEAFAQEIQADSRVKAALEAQVASIISPWSRFFLRYDPTDAFRKTTCPVLAITGTLDVQVVADLNLAAIADALAQGGNERVTIIEMEGLNHLFQHATTGLMHEYAQIEETFAPEALEHIAGWILDLSSSD